MADSDQDRFVEEKEKSGNSAEAQGSVADSTDQDPGGLPDPDEIDIVLFAVELNNIIFEKVREKYVDHSLESDPLKFDSLPGPNVDESSSTEDKCNGRLSRSLEVASSTSRTIHEYSEKHNMNWTEPPPEGSDERPNIFLSDGVLTKVEEETSEQKSASAEGIDDPDELARVLLELSQGFGVPLVCKDGSTWIPPFSKPPVEDIGDLQPCLIRLFQLLAKRFDCVDSESKERNLNDCIQFGNEKDRERSGEEEVWEGQAVTAIRDGPSIFKLNVNYGLKKTIPKNSYKMESLPRGRAVIYNVTKNRKGSEPDVANLRSLFLRLGFCVRVVSEPSAEEFRQSLKEERNRDDLKDMDSFVVFIMAHGTSRGILFMQDGEEVNVEEVELDEKAAPLLVDKPKMVFIQACRNDDTTNSYRQLFGASGAEYDAAKAGGSRQCASKDVFVSYSTYEGLKAARFPNKGSCFVRALVLSMARHAHEWEYHSIMAQVHRLVLRSAEGEFVQVPQKEDTGTLALFLSPTRQECLIAEAESSPRNEKSKK